MDNQKFALVTGGGRGIGREISIKLATELKYQILVNYHKDALSAQQTCQAILEQGGQAEAIGFDVTNLQQVQEKLALWKAQHPEAVIEVIVNNAGIRKDGLLMWMEQADWTDVVGTSLTGFYNVTRTLVQDLLRHRYGRIINITSVSGLKGTPGQTNYSAAKAGLIGATKALAQEIAKRNITVNAVAPGFIETDMTAGLDAAELRKWIPLNRFGRPEEVADLVCFLASGKASYITGEVININGGIYA